MTFEEAKKEWWKQKRERGFDPVIWRLATGDYRVQPINWEPPTPNSRIVPYGQEEAYRQGAQF